MDIDKIFEKIIIIDKKILSIYQQMIRNEYIGKDNKNNIEVLKELVELEKWAYQRLNFDYETLESIRDILEKKVDQMQDLFDKILILRINSDDLLKSVLPEEYIQKMVYFRINDFITNIYHLHPNSPKNIGYYQDGEYEYEKNDDKSDIYLLDSSYLPMKKMHLEQYIKEAINNHKVVLTFDTKTKKELELEAITDLTQLIIILLKLKVLQNHENRYYYLEEMYSEIFKSQKIEERLLKSNFDFDILYDNFSHSTQTNKNNKNFINVVRQQASYFYICSVIDFIFKYRDTNFRSNNKKFNLINFQILLDYIRAHVGFLRYDELVAIRECCQQEYKDVIEKNKCAQMVYESLSDDYYKLLQSLLEIEDEEKQMLV